MSYDVDYFIAKFEAIPDELWCQGDFVKGVSKCAVAFTASLIACLVFFYFFRFKGDE